jgi:hypothetical protein
MKPSEIKQLIISSLEANTDTGKIAARLEDEGVYFDFAPGFGERVLNRVSSGGAVISREPDFAKGLNYIFYRIAFTGVAAIVLLLLSIYITEGSVSLNSFLGLGNGADESILYILAGN